MPHPLYGVPSFGDNDIAVLKLAGKLQFNTYTKAVILSGSEPVPGYKVLAAGWGQLSVSDTS